MKHFRHLGLFLYTFLCALISNASAYNGDIFVRGYDTSKIASPSFFVGIGCKQSFHHYSEPSFYGYDPYYAQQEVRDYAEHQEKVNVHVATIDSVFSRTYEIDSYIKKRLHLSKEQVKVLSECTGTEVQQAVHNDCRSVLYSLSVCTDKGFAEPVNELARDAAHVVVDGCQANKQGDTDAAKATVIFAQKIVLVCHAFGKGIVQGTQQTVSSFLHPIEASKAALFALCSLADVLGGILLEDHENGFCPLSQGELANIKAIHDERVLKLCDTLGGIWEALKNASAEQVAYFAGKQLAEGILFAGLHKACTLVSPALKSRFLYRKAAPRAPPKTSLITVHGKNVYSSPEFSNIMEPRAWWTKKRNACESIDFRKLAFESELLSYQTAEHIFVGATKNGKASGFHVLGIPGSKGKIVAGSERLLDATHAIWEANVVIDGILKGPLSTFFPIWMTPKQILTAIAEAYENRVFQFDNIYEGITHFGFKIQLYIDKKGQIVSAFPVV